MMRARCLLLAVCLMFMAAVSATGKTDSAKKETVVLGSEIMPKDTTKKGRFKNHLIAPKGEWQCGISVMYASFSSSDSEFMMLLQGMTADASLLRLAPEAAYTYTNNHAVGVRFQYTNINGALDAATADLLGNFSMSVENISAKSSSLSASVYHRSFWGLDRRGRVGLFWDYILGYTRTNTTFSAGGASSPYTITNKVHLGFAPGLVYFPMNNVSVQASVCLADVSYNYVKTIENEVVTGSRQAWKAQASLNVLDLNFGLTIHF